MREAIMSELRKLLTVRSTYVIIALCLVMLGLFAFFISGYRQTADVTGSGVLASQITAAASATGVLIALIGLLLVAHEYRYNTIMYTMTSAKSRAHTLLAKFIVISVFSIILTLIICALSPLLAYLGMQLKGLDVAAQNIPYVDLFWRSVFYGWAYSMFALIIAFIVRSQVGAIALLLLFPATIELILTLLLKERGVYLPFTALGGVLQQSTLSHAQSAWVTLLYIAGGGAVAYTLFMKRDAN